MLSVSSARFSGNARGAIHHAKFLPFSTSIPAARRAVIFTSNGPASQSVRVISCPDLGKPARGHVNIRYLLSPINPSDINVIEGVYPAKPAPRTNLTARGPGSKEEPCFVVGNEGLAEVTETGEGVTTLVPGDRVVMVKPQAGTWSTNESVLENEIIKIPSSGGKTISDIQGATMTVNPPTAFNMLNQFVKLQPGEWVIQNGANSAVGQAIIQIAHERGLKTINFVRNRPDFSGLEDQLKDLGATCVLPLESLSDKSLRARIKDLTHNANIRLALNCVSGPTTAGLVGLLGRDAHLVSYGAMSKQPMSIPTGAFIFKGLTAHGFMQNVWYQRNGLEKRQELMQELVGLMVTGKLKEPIHSILTISESLNDDKATSLIRDVLRELTEGDGRVGMKMLLKFS